MQKTILAVVGTRPNFIKVTRFREVAARYPQFTLKIVHTGQHFDEKMADVFFRQFGLVPDIFLDIPQASPNTQMAEIMLRLEKVIAAEKPELLMVPGDVNSTLAAALTANKTGVKIAHIESGLRSFDRTMPEEFNRILTDQLADMLFVTEQSGLDHLAHEHTPPERIHFVGNTMIDTMVKFSAEIDSSPILDQIGTAPGQYVLMTMHRPATVDTAEGLTKLLKLLRYVTAKRRVVFPIHPRTVKNMREAGLENEFTRLEGLLLTEPLDYFAFQKLVKNCSFILTDSGGIQEESTFLQVPCLTLRPNTERPVTVTLGSNELLPFDLDVIAEKITQIENGTFKRGQIPPLWDGFATERIFEVLAKEI
ncbi:MAG: UDP-N-acetylglucosamine 2-epimerase (non-hydrolyzing) [Bacteroidia bacterium]|nr:UDP-N-acetylglucosamine 2-epimerase (non-hydrolyzing) [Bacteroidia bacterium]